MQSRMESLKEALGNTGVAFVLSLISQRYLIAPLQDWHVQAGGELTQWLPAILITVYYTLLSIGRNYVIRRLGNRRQGRGG